MAELVVFMKNPASVIGSGDPIVIGSVCAANGPQVDYEGELALIIGCDCRDVDPSDARSVLSGYCVANDVSARWWQKKGSGGQFCRGKSFDSFCPITKPIRADSVGNPSQLTISTTLNGERVQHCSVAEMTWSVDRLIAELSRGMTLLRNTLILTGTPAGVGSARTPQRWLRSGDLITVEIPGVGCLSNPVIEEV